MTSLPESIDYTKAQVAQQKLDEDNLRREPPLIRYWDSEWNLQFIGGMERRAQFAWISNDTGPAQIELDFDSPLAQWIHDADGRLARGEGRNIGITVDYCGARWSGIMDKFTVDQRDDSDVALIVDWQHDYEHLKWVSCWANPHLHAALQIPRAFVCAGPLTWALKTALLLNLAREHNPLLAWHDDPLDKEQWDEYLDMSGWHMAVHPGTFYDAMNSGIMWGVVTSRFATWHDMAHIMLEDSELSVRCDRWLTGDPPPWQQNGVDYIPRNGQLIVDIVDKSGVNIGTGTGGTIFSGLIRTVQQFSSDFLDSTQELLSDTVVPSDYYTTGNKYTDKERPFAVFREGETSPIQTSQWIHSPAKGIQVIVGGHSMPGVVCALR